MYIGFALLDASLYQGHQSGEFERALKDKVLGQPMSSIDYRHALPSARPSKRTRSLPPADSTATRANFPLGRIEIGAIGLEVMILEGTDDQTLRRGVGHIPGTSLPGQEGNIAIAGHRDTYFRELRRIRTGDEITLTALNGLHRYLVDFTEVVDPENVTVLNDSSEPILTLVTCYPFHYIGFAPKRFIVRAHRSPG
jgi:LPXTG-site transpeptidase (sortase) family protein